MRVLVLYRNHGREFRKTIAESLFCFREYSPENQFFYVNSDSRIPKLLRLVEFDAVILHYSLLALRYHSGLWDRFMSRSLATLRELKGVKIAIPQDEYNHTDALRFLFREMNVDVIFSCSYAKDHQKIYPFELTQVKSIHTVYTGYIDEKALDEINALRKSLQRKVVDIGYRARALPYWLGRHSQLKKDIYERFSGADTDGLVLDVGLTDDDSNAYLGNEWTKYLLRSRTMPGCLGGSGLLDASGSIRDAVEQFLSANPEASFDETEEACFKGEDGSIGVYALSPRHFECAMTKTCQLLVEGDYDGVFEAGVHYIEIRKDFSNIHDVIEKVRDVEYCERIAEKCYEDVVLSGKYTYRKFVKTVLAQVGDGTNKRRGVSSQAAYWILLTAIMGWEAARLVLRKTYHLLWKITHGD